MNLKDLVGNSGLQQDGWSLTEPSFGEDNQLTVVGWSGRDAGHKVYITRCTLCCKDSELFGEGYFRSFKGHLRAGCLPCGCSNYTKWSKEQYVILCQRSAEELGYKFLGFVGEWKASKTKVDLQCRYHGNWTRCVIHHLLSSKAGCPDCFAINIGKQNTKPDQVMISSFHASGAFHPDTKFWRSEREDNLGHKRYWLMSCPECGSVGESISSNLQLGQRSCACNNHRQQECYINLIIDDYNITAIKFGVARDSKQRIKQQDYKSTYTLKQYRVYTFPSVHQCRQAERECKKELECGVVLKRDMPDGYTETTWVYNLDKIIEIYERNGGILQENP